MAMTLRLDRRQTDALRRRAQAERTSMQDVALRAVDEYIRTHEPEVPVEVVIDQELGRFADALQRLARWQD